MKPQKNLIDLVMQCNSLADAKALLSSYTEPESFVSIHNEQGLYLEVSNGFISLTSRTPESVKGTSAYEYFRGDDLKEILKSHATVTLRPEVSEVSYRLRKQDDSYVAVTSYSKNVEDENGVMFIVVITSK